MKCFSEREIMATGVVRASRTKRAVSSMMSEKDIKIMDRSLYDCTWAGLWKKLLEKNS